MKYILPFLLLLVIAGCAPKQTATPVFIFQDDFQNAPVFNNGNPALGYTGWDETCCNWSFVNSDSFAVSATKSGRFELRKTDPSPQPNDSKRTQMEWNGFAVPMGAVWYAMDIMPAAWMGIDPAPEDLFDLHDRMPGGASSNWTNPFGIWNENGHWTAHITYQTLPIATNSPITKRYDLGVVVPGKFVNWVLHTNYSWRDTGYVQLWKDGVLVIDYKGPCAYNGAMPDPYFKFGIYKWPWASSTFQPPSSQVTRVFYFDNFKVGNRQNVLADFVTSTANKPPVANAGADQSLPGTASSFTLTGSGTDADGTIASYLWETFLTPTGWYGTNTNAVWNLTGATAGKYGYKLTVTDNKGSKGVDTCYVTIAGVNQPPVINSITGSPVDVTIPVAYFTLDIVAADPDGDAVAYTWTRPGGTTSNGRTLMDTVRIAGDYTYKATVTDQRGAATTVNVPVHVNPIPSKLIIRVEVVINNTTGGYIVTHFYADGTQAVYQ